MIIAETLNTLNTADLDNYDKSDHAYELAP